MHPFMLLLGSALVTYSQTLGQSVYAAGAAVLGGALIALAKRTKIPVLRALPKFAPAGSALAMALSVACFIGGSAMIGIATAFAHQPALAIFLPVVGSGMLMMFDTADFAGDTAPPSVAGLLAALWFSSVALSCAHVTPVTNCIEAQLGPSAPAVIAEVEADLAQANWSDLLINVAGRIGWSALGCVLDDLQQKGKLSMPQQDHLKSFKIEHQAKLHG